MEIKGYIKSYDGEVLTIIAPFDKEYLLEQQDIVDCNIRLNDGRTISNAQRRKIFALASDIGDYVSRISNQREYVEVLRQLKLLYVKDKTDNETIRRTLTRHYCELIDSDVFSLSDCSVSVARGFIDWLVELCLDFEIPCNDSLAYLCEDINRYMYLCIAKRKCAICGRKADIHEVEKVGMGGNRRKMHHKGQLCEALCRLHHHEVENNTPQKEFDEKYHINPIRLDEYLCRQIGWKA